MSDDLSEFLLAKIAEVEGMAKAAKSGPWKWSHEEFSDTPEPQGAEWIDRGPDLLAAGQHREGFDAVMCAVGPYVSNISIAKADAKHIAYWNPTHVLAECEAKRQLIELARDAIEIGKIEPNTTWNDDAGGIRVGEGVLRYLALPYADHPDYRQEWKL